MTRSGREAIHLFHADAAHAYSTREVAELIGLRPDQVRHCVRRRLVAPKRDARGNYRFSFQDVVLLRAARRLLDAEITPRQTMRSLLKLKAAYTPDAAGDVPQREAADRSLASLKVFACGKAVLVQDANVQWEVETGQGQFSFENNTPDVPAASVVMLNTVMQVETAETALQDMDTLLARLPEPGADPEVSAGVGLDGAAGEGGLELRGEQLTSDEWYNLGLDLEELGDKRAVQAYRKAIETDPRNADAHVNIGRLFQLRGDLKRAKRHYQLAVTAMPTHQLAHYNLGTLFDELDELEQAARYYKLAPGVPDAHYNLARICELMGDEVSSRRHMRQYRELLERDQ